MGCNTSQDTAPTAAEAQDQRTVEEKKKDATTERENSKPTSALTELLVSNGIAIGDTGGKIVNTDNSAKLENPGNETELEEAAVKIQAAFRGHQTRKNMKQPAKNEETSPAPQNLEEEFNLDDKELCHAATKIQASFRGHMSRKQMEKKEDEPLSPPENKHEEEELDIDLSDPDLNKAALKIQASFRGHMVRKDHEDVHSNSK